MKDQNNPQQGTGSAEHRNESRESQKNQTAGLSEEQRNDIDKQVGAEVPVTDIRSTGALSGRDDAAGGSGDRMEDTSSNQETDR